MKKHLFVSLQSLTMRFVVRDVRSQINSPLHREPPTRDATNNSMQRSESAQAPRCSTYKGESIAYLSSKAKHGKANQKRAEHSCLPVI